MTERDPFRERHKLLSDTEARLIGETKEAARGVDDTLLNATSFTNVDHRALDLARTKLEEAVMWATKAISA